MERFRKKDNARARTADMKRPRAVEVACMRGEMKRAATGLAVPVIIFFAQLFIPSRRHALLPNLCCLAVLVTSQFSTMYLLKWAGSYQSLKSAFRMNSAIHHTSRTLGHISYMYFSSDDMFGRLFFLFLAPCSATRHSRHATFTAYLVIHMILLVYRFGCSFAEDYPFLIASAGCCHILHEISVLKEKGEESALEKSRLMVSLTEDVAEAVFDCFCDATARLSVGLEIFQDSASLSTLLNRNVSAGRLFTDFVHMGYREEYRDFMNQSTSESEGSGGEIDCVGSLRLRSIDMHLEDSMNIPIETHIFHARLTDLDENPFYLIGISERESYLHSKKKGGVKERVKRRARAELPSLDFDSGKVIPSRPAFKAKDVEGMRDIETLRRGEAEADEKAMKGQRHSDNPRPANQLLQGPRKSDSPRPVSKPLQGPHKSDSPRPASKALQSPHKSDSPRPPASGDGQLRERRT